MNNLPKVTLRAIEPEDLDFLYRIENDRQLWDIGATNVPYSRYALHEYVANASTDIYTDKQVRLIIEDEQHEAIGLADLTNFDPRHLRAEIGLVIVKSQRGKHLAHSALLKLHDYAEHTLRLHQIYAVIGSENMAAIQLFKKMGYDISLPMKDWIFDGNCYQNALLLQKIL